VIAALLLIGCLPGPSLAGEKAWQKIKTPKLRELKVPEVVRATLPNGLQLFVLEDHELPLLRMSLTMEGGSAHSPQDRRGLAEITAAVLRTGGSETLPGDRMDEVLEGMGGSIETGVENLTTRVSLDVLVEDTDRALQMLSDLVRQPAFPEEKLDLELKQWRSGIARRNDDPSGIADREFDRLLYGLDHPFVAQVEYEHLARIQRQDLVRFHAAVYHPTRAYLAVWGDFVAADIVKRIESVLGAWPKSEVTLPAVPEVPATTPSVNLAVKESVNQSNIRIGHRGTTAKDPDYYALSVMNEILGGSFGSRLFNEVRSRQGLSYGVWSTLGAGLQYPGMFTVNCGTKSETTVKAVQACIEEVKRMKTQAITPAELERAKSGILNSHVFNFTNKGAIVNRQVNYVRNGYPADFLEQFARRIESVTVEDVKRAAESYLRPEQFVVMVVGKPADFGEALSVLGPVKEIDISIPEPPTTEAYPAPTAETLEQGKSLLTATAKAMGGVEALRKVTNLTETADVTLNMMGQSLPAKARRFVRYPDRFRYEIEVMGQKMVQVYDGQAQTGFQQGPMGAKEFEPQDIADARSEQARDMLVYLRDPEVFRPQYLGEAEVKGAAVDVVLLSPEGREKFKIYVDRKTQLVIKEEYRGKSFQGVPVDEERFLEDYRKVRGLLLPHRSTVHQDGQLFVSSQVTSYGWEEIPPDRFTKPQS
jgi:zinc protease